jgi:hypothetical protein
MSLQAIFWLIAVLIALGAVMMLLFSRSAPRRSTGATGAMPRL